MMFSRMHIIGIAYQSLAQAATIAIRYSVVRQQGFKNAQTEYTVSALTHHCVVCVRVGSFLSLPHSLLPGWCMAVTHTSM